MSDFQEFQFSDNRKKVDFQLIDSMDSHKTENSPNMVRDSLKAESGFDLRKSLAWDTAFFTSPGVLDAEELFETLNYQKEPNSLLSKSISPARTSAIDNLRKSLAWDSAFFTSAGVLDAEELSMLNRGYRTPETLRFPKSDEEIWRSAESNSTITSDGYSLASLEIDLFDDIREYINKSNASSKSNGPTSTCKFEGNKQQQKGLASKITKASSRARYAASSGESKSHSSVKPPKISGRSNPSSVIPSKRSSLGSQATKSASGKDMAMSKKLCLRESHSSKPPARSPSSADFTSKSPSNTALRRMTRNPHLTASGSNLRTQSKCFIQKQNESINFLSTPKSSAYASPASSLDGWPSTSPLMSSIKQRSNASPREISFSIGASKPSSGHEIQETKFENPQTNNTSVCTSPASVSRVLRPSGLRMPSPKIGYFDEENCAGIAQNAALNFHSGTPGHCRPRTGNSNSSGNTNRTRNGKHRLAGSSSLKEKKQLGHVKALQCPEFYDDDKENTSIGSLTNEVEDLSGRIRNIDFYRDFITELKAS